MKRALLHQLIQPSATEMFRLSSLKTYLNSILLIIIVQLGIIVADLALQNHYDELEETQLRFNHLNEEFMATLLLEKDIEQNHAARQELLIRYSGLTGENTSGQLLGDDSLLPRRIDINTQLFQLWEERNQLHARLNLILPELAGSVSYIHRHHIAYLKNLSRRNSNTVPVVSTDEFVRQDNQPGSELDIVSSAIEIQNTVLELIEIFSRLQRGFSSSSIRSGFADAMDRFYERTNTFEDYSLDAQDGLLVEELLSNGATFEQSFNRFLEIEEQIASARTELETNRHEILTKLATNRTANGQQYERFNQRLERNRTIFLVISVVMLVVLLVITRKLMVALARIAAETGRIEMNHRYRIPLQPNDFQEVKLIFNALNLMGSTVEKKLDELAQSQEMLEDVVKQRTVELSETNRRLRSEIEQRQANERQRRELEEKLSRAEKMEALGTLAGGVAHDLNNLLSGIVSYPELLLLDLEPDHKWVVPLKSIQDSGEKAAVIVEDLLTMARRGVARYQPLDLSKMVEEFRQSHEFRHVCKRHPEIAMEFVQEKGGATIKGSKVHLMKTLLNLVCNAAESITTSGELRISTATVYVDTLFRNYDQVAEGEYAKLSVADNGSGISAENLERIFEPFFTTKTMGKSGSGLGMAVVWGTVKDHQGYIDVTSTPGKGSCFDLYFPLHRNQGEEAPESTVNIETQRGHGERVLVIDDVQTQRQIATSILQRLGYEVDSVAGGEAALLYLRKQTVDILLLDMIMSPGMDGLESYKAIIAEHPGQRAIIVSGYSESSKVIEAQRLGAGAYVKKPYSFAELAIALRGELDKEK